MRLIGILITASILLAAMQAAAAALVIALLLVIVIGVFLYPRETFGLVGFCLLAGLIERHPLACLGFASLAILTGAARRP